MWSVTLADRVLRLNFGPVEVFLIFNDRAWFPVLGGKRSKPRALSREPAPHKKLGEAELLVGAQLPIAVAFESFVPEFRSAVQSVRALYKTTDSYLNGAAKRAHARGLLDHLEERLGSALPRPGWDDDAVRPDSSASAAIEGHLEADLEEVLGIEGGRALRTHLRIERDGSVARAAKASWAVRDPLLRCEVCRFSAEVAYGRRYCEAHHRVPLATLDEATEMRVEDVACVCANCHRALHRETNLTVELLRARVLAQPRPTASLCDFHPPDTSAAR